MVASQVAPLSVENWAAPEEGGVHITVAPLASAETVPPLPEFAPVAQAGNGFQLVPPLVEKAP